MFKVTIEELDRKDCLLTLRLNINNEYESGLIINPYDCFTSIISNPTNSSLDVLYFTSIIYAIDKVIQRVDTFDNWSRDIEIEIPVSNGFCELEKAKLFYKELLLNKGFKELKEVAEFSLKKLEENNEIKFNGKFESLFHVLEELERDDEYDYFDELDVVDYYENLPLENDLDKHWREGINQEEWDYFEFNEPREVVKIGRNDACPCGSGKKYKKCCGK